MPEVPADQFSRRAFQPILDSLEEHLHQEQNFQQQLLQSLEAFQADCQLGRLAQRHLAAAALVAHLEHQIHGCKSITKQYQRQIQILRFTLEQLPV